MSAASNYLENAVLDHVLGNATFTQPSTIYVGLWTADDGLEGGTLTSEVSGGSYARQTITFGEANGGSASNDTTITFPTATASWGTITHVAILDAASGGNVLYHGAVNNSRTIESGDTFQISSGNFTVTLA